jgi:hypothetical protein
MTISAQRRQEIIDALRRGTVPGNSLDAFAVGLEKFQPALEEDLDRVARGAAVFKAVRGEYGCGKTFFSRWLADTARRKGFATSEVQISETETPLHRLETVYRRLMERLSTSAMANGALRQVVDAWFYALEEDVLAEGTISPEDSQRLLARTDELLEQRLVRVSEQAPAFSAALRGYRKAVASGDRATADALLAWVSGQPNVAASARRVAGVRGDIDHFGALGFLQGMLTVLRDSGHPGLLLVLDEVETLQRVRSDARDKGLNALRQLLDEVDGGRFPGLFLMITGTPAFYEGPQGVKRLEPLAQRLHVDFQTDEKFDNPRAVQIRLPAFDMDRLVLVGRKVRDIYCQHSLAPDRIASLCDDDYVKSLAEGVTGKLGGKVGVAPRIFLKKLVSDVLDRVDQFDAFNPRKDYALTLTDAEMKPVERQAMGAAGVDDIDLEM